MFDIHLCLKYELYYKSFNACLFALSLGLNELHVDQFWSGGSAGGITVVKVQLAYDTVYSGHTPDGSLPGPYKY